MTTLRSRAIRLAYTQPSLRPHLLPLLKRAMSPEAIYEKALEDLTDAAAISDSVQDVLDGFRLHYASAEDETKILSEFQVLDKARNGLRHAQEAQRALKGLTGVFPGDPKYSKALTETDKVVATLEKQAKAATVIIRTLSKKIAPKALMAMVKKVEAGIKAWLLDPTKLEVFYNWQRDSQKKVYFNGVFRAGSPDLQHKVLYLREYVSGAPGITMGTGDYDMKPASVNDAVDQFITSVRGWDNIKGETEGRKVRENTAKAIAAVLQGTRMGWDSDEATISQDFRTVEWSYRSSNLPKEGANAVGEYQYDEMVRGEIAHAGKAIELKLAPYKDKIERVTFNDGEKSWVYITVHLK